MLIFQIATTQSKYIHEDLVRRMRLHPEMETDFFIANGYLYTEREGQDVALFVRRTKWVGKLVGQGEGFAKQKELQCPPRKEEERPTLRKLSGKKELWKSLSSFEEAIKRNDEQ